MSLRSIISKEFFESAGKDTGSKKSSRNVSEKVNGGEN